MKKIMLLALTITSQTRVTAQVSPGLKPEHKTQLAATGYKIPAPASLPRGFTADTIITLTGKPIEDWNTVIYSIQ